LKKKFVCIFIFVLINSYVVVSQAFYTGNLYYTDPYTINPAYAGYLGTLSTEFNFSQTVASFDGAPVSYKIGLHSPVYRNMSLGTRIYRQSEGLFANTSLFLDYSYLLKLTESKSLRFGIAGGLKTNHLDYSKIIAEDPSAIIEVASRNFDGSYFQSAAGVAYNWNRLDISLKKIFNPIYCTFLTYRFGHKNQDISFKPSVLTTFNKGQSMLYDLNFTTYWKNIFFIGVSYRNRPAAIFSGGFNMKDLSLFYAVEFGLQKYANVFGQIHEIAISYTFNKKKIIQKDTISNPDFPLVAKTDTLKSDTTKNVFVFKNDSVNNQLVTKTDSLKTVAKNDSSLVNGIDKKKYNSLENYKIVSLGDGIYSIEYKTAQTDSSKLHFNPDSVFKDDSIVTANLLNKILLHKNEDLIINVDKKPEYYTIQLFLNENNNEILRDAEISVDTWFETDEKGNFLYFLGHFETEEQARIRKLKLNKYQNLVSEIIKRN